MRLLMAPPAWLASGRFEWRLETHDHVKRTGEARGRLGKPTILWVVDGLPKDAASDKKEPRTLFDAPHPGAYSEFGS